MDLNKIKHLDISLLNHLQDLYAKNHKMLMKKIKEVPNKWKGIPCTQTRRQDIAKMSAVPTLIGLTQ